jgi:hypothetical protein
MFWSQPKPWAKTMGRSPRPLTCTLFLARMSIEITDVPDLLRSSNESWQTVTTL